MTSIVRGNTIRLAFTFTDGEGDPYTPSGAFVELDFPGPGTTRQQESIDLEDGGDGSWIADWDSSAAARAGKVNYTVYSNSPNPKIAQDGFFSLTANAANTVAIPVPA